MLYAYRQRVFHYLQKRLLYRVGKVFFENMRDKFFELKTESIKEQKALDLYHSTLEVKSFVAIRMFVEHQRVKQYQDY